MRLFAFITIAVVLAGNDAFAQSNKKAWSFSASAYTYIVPDSRD